MATVLAFGSADSHDENYFQEPDAMIRGTVIDPTLTLDNYEIVMRHVAAYLLQMYHQARLPHVDPDDQPQLFEVLGTVENFLDATAPLNRFDFESWLDDARETLEDEVNQWIPRELGDEDRELVFATMIESTLSAIDDALGRGRGDLRDDEGLDNNTTESADVDSIVLEAQAESGEEHSNPNRAVENLLDRLLYKGVLPRYAFPTDVVSFYVFDRNRSTRFRPEFSYAPSQGLPTALSQYAPGKEVWIDGKLWSSGALYSPMRGDRYQAWQDRRLYFECELCRYASTETTATASRGESRDCPACGADGRFGTAKNWIRPPGFAHPVAREEGTSPDDQPASSFATRAKLVAPGPADEDAWVQTTERVRQYFARTHLLVTNSGPRREGYTYCTRCGLIEPTSMPSGMLAGQHTKPFPDDREPTCDGGASTRGLVIGTDFITDVLLISARVDDPLTLLPGYLATDVALRTLSEALTISGTRMLDIEPNEIQAEFRPALTQFGHQGLEVEIYLYDTLAGGAGFARRLGEAGEELYHRTLSVLESCPASCDRSCYRCLRSFKNRFEHGLLDRQLGASLLRYLIDGSEPVLTEDRLESAADRLFADLERLGIEGRSFSRNTVVDVPGIGRVNAPILAESRGRKVIVGIHGPLTPNHLIDQGLREAKEYGSSVPVVLVDEIVISRNLPSASQRVVEALG